MSEKPNIDSVFCTAIEIESPEERGLYLERACGDDVELKGRVERLLDAHFQGGSILDEPAGVSSSTIDQPITEKPGDMIGPYKLLQELGEGGMGTVYMAEQEEPVRRRVALKIIKPGMDSKQVIARFEAERQALALMDHHNIARVLDAGTTDSGRPYFAMELVKGVPFITYCDHNRLTVRERLELFVPVCQAIQHAHQKGIIHRDIKPSNVLVTLYDGKPVPKVIDFGIAKATQQKLTERTMFTQMGQIVGTWEYMSPEQAEMNALDVDTRSDVYSLGVMLYELLTGTTPITRQQLRQGGLAQILAVIHDFEPPKPSTRLSDSGDALPSISAVRKTEPARLSKLVRGDLDWIVMKALEKDRTRRYETANGLAIDIGRFLQDEAVTACPPSAAYKLRKFARRNRAALAMICTLAVILLTATSVSIWQAMRATQAGRLAHARLVEAETERDRANRQRDRAVTAEELAAERLKESEQAREEAEAVSKFLSEAFRSPDPERDGRTITVAEVLDRAVERLAIDLAEQPDHQAVLREAIAQTYHSLGLYQPAITLREQILDYFVEHSGPEHPDTLGAMSKLVLSYQSAGRGDEALTLSEQLVELSRKIHGAEHYYTLWTTRRLANSIRAAGRLEEALQIYEQLLPLSRKIRGAEHYDTIRVMHHRAVTLHLAGRRDEAIRLFEQVLALSEKSLGTEHNGTVSTMKLLAILYGESGRLDDGIPLFEQVLRLRRKSHGEQDPQTLENMINLAHSYNLVGRREDALQLLEQARETLERLVQENPSIPNYRQKLAHLYNNRALMSTTAQQEAVRNGSQAIKDATRACELTDWKEPGYLNTFAAAYAESGDFEQAVQTLEQALELSRNIHGAEHAETLVTMHNLATSYNGAGRREEAIKLFEQLLPLSRKIHGAEHPDTARTMTNLAVAYRDTGQLDEALQLFEQLLQLRRKILGAEHPETLATISELVAAYGAAGRRDDALQLIEQALEPLEQLVRDQPSVPAYQKALTSIRNNRALLLAAAENSPPSIRLLEQALGLSRKMFGAESPQTLTMMNGLAVAYQLAGRREEGLQLFEQGLLLSRKIRGAEHPNTIATMHNLALSYSKAGRREEAIQLFEQVLPLRRKVLGADHPDAVTTMHNLAESYGDAGRWDDAHRLFEQARELQERLVQENPSVPQYRACLAHIYIKRAWWLATAQEEAVRNGPLAVKDATRACELTDWKDFGHLYILAAAYAESGDFEQAVKYQQEALELAPDTLKSEFEQPLGLYKEGKPYRDGVSAESPSATDE